GAGTGSGARAAAPGGASGLGAAASAAPGPASMRTAASGAVRRRADFSGCWPRMATSPFQPALAGQRNRLSVREQGAGGPRRGPPALPLPSPVQLVWLTPWPADARFPASPREPALFACERSPAEPGLLTDVGRASCRGEGKRKGDG